MRYAAAMNEKDQLIKTLREHMPPQVQAAAFFEADAAGNEVNLVLIGDGLSGLRPQALFAPVGRELGRRVEVHVYSAAEWSGRVKSDEGFEQDILSGRVVTICGELQRESENDSVDANLARMQNPLFKRAARALEQNIPNNVGFGRFRDRN